MINPNEQPAAAAYVAAVEHHTEKTQRSAECHDAHQKALAERQALINKAGEGVEVEHTAVMAADDVVRAAAAEHEVAAAIAEAAGSARDRAEIEALAEEVATIASERDAIIAHALAEAKAADAAVCDAQAALARMQATVAGLSRLPTRCYDLTYRIGEAVRRNSALAEMHPSVRPKAPIVTASGAIAELSVHVVRPANVYGETVERCIIPQPIAPMVAALGGAQ